MEAITIGGLAVVIVGGYYTLVDFFQDMGIRFTLAKRCRSKRRFVAPQITVKKMAWMHI